MTASILSVDAAPSLRVAIHIARSGAGHAVTDPLIHLAHKVLGR